MDREGTGKGGGAAKKGSLSEGVPTMRKWIAGPAVAGLLLVGSATVAEATTAPAQEDTTSEDDSSKVGLFGLLGLAGLAGLAGLKRRDDGRRYDQRGSGSSTRTP